MGALGYSSVNVDGDVLPSNTPAHACCVPSSRCEDSTLPSPSAPLLQTLPLTPANPCCSPKCDGCSASGPPAIGKECSPNPPLSVCPNLGSPPTPQSLPSPGCCDQSSSYSGMQSLGFSLSRKACSLFSLSRCATPTLLLMLIGRMKRMSESVLSTESSPSSKRSRSAGVSDLRLLIQAKTAGSIIGKGGSNISRLRSEYPATITIPDCPGPERVLTVRGDYSIVLKVLEEVLNALAEAIPRTDESDVRLLVHQSQAGAIIGKGGEKIKELREGELKRYGKGSGGRSIPLEGGEWEWVGPEE
ncbi:K domain type 1 [Trinorchestia longiramus]|nr:K domain type 1 [Trinorchestia longiramus]